MKTKTIIVPEIIDEAKSAGCENDAQIHGYLAGEISRLRPMESLLQQMLDVAENADETGYITDVGFVDLEKLHNEARAALEGRPIGDPSVHP